MNIYSYMFSLLFALLILLFAGCEGEPVFTEMSTNRLNIIIKGTLESEKPVIDKFDFIPGETLASSKAAYVDDSVNSHPVQSEDKMPATFMLDIAEIRLNGKAIGKYRQAFPITLDDDEPFFNGTGITLKNDDPGNGTYDTVQLYIRKMIFDNAKIYHGAAFENEEMARVIFKEDEVEGFNFNNLQVNSYWDSLRDNASSVLRVYPLEIPIIGGMNYDRNNDRTVLEIRIVIKNFIKMYEYDYYDAGIFKVCHFYGFSDWLRDVRKDERNMGRNIIAVARAYVPDKAVKVTRTDTSAANCYVMAIPDTNKELYSISSSGSALRGSVGWADLPAAPVYSGGHIESVLDYYCNYEAYKSEWNDKYDDYTGAESDRLTDYEIRWDSYEASVENFRIAPYLTVADASGNYTFNNVQPGTYYIYYHAAPSAYGELFTGTWDSVNSEMPITVP